MLRKQVKKRVWLLALTVLALALVTPACGETVSPTPTATPRPTSKVDTGMGGSLSIQGVVRDTFGNVAPDVYVTITVYEEGGGGDFRRLGHWGLYTDETGSYSFNNLLRAEGGHYEVWFNGSNSRFGIACHSSVSLRVQKRDYGSAFWHQPSKMKPMNSFRVRSSDGTARVNTTMSPWRCVL